MRKLIWCATAMTVFGAAAVYMAAQHAAEHPDSVAGRFFRVAGLVGMRCNPMMVIGGLTHSKPASGPVDKPMGVPACAIPEPAPMIQPPPHVALPEFSDAPEMTEPIVVDSEPPALPVDAPPVGAPPVGETLPPPRALGPNEEGQDGSTFITPQEVTVPPDQVPEMPYVTDDDELFDDGAVKVGVKVQAMCGEESCPGARPKTLGELIAGYLTRLAGGMEEPSALSDDPVQEDPVKDADDAPSDADMADEEPAAEPMDEPATDDMPAADEGPMNPYENAVTPMSGYLPGPLGHPRSQEEQDSTTPPDGQPAPLQEDPAYHHHYPSCPYTGRCPYPYHYSVPRVEPVNPPRAEEQEPKSKPPVKPMKPLKPVKKKFLLLFMGEMDFCHPDVDTMECRPTDIHGEVESPF